jgi:hypothetical protein
MIRCNCKTDCKTMRCTCKKHGLDCSPACGICKGQTCLNSSPPDLTSEDDWTLQLNFVLLYVRDTNCVLSWNIIE